MIIYFASCFRCLHLQILHIKAIPTSITEFFVPQVHSEVLFEDSKEPELETVNQRRL